MCGENPSIYGNTIITYTPASDSNSGSAYAPFASLTAAISKCIANKACTIFLDGTVNETVGTISGNRTITIKPFGESAKIIKKTAGSSLIRIPSSSNLTMDGITLDGNEKGSDGHGGGIYNEGTLVFSNGTITNCCCTTSDDVNSGNGYGGGVYNTGTFTMSNSTISNSIASKRKEAAGGGVYNTGTFTMNNSTISGCSANEPYANGSDPAAGGGIYNTGSFTMTGGTISDCQTSTGTYVFLGRGGGIYTSKAISLNNCTIENCKTKSSSSSAYGGGIYILSETTSITDCTVTGCESLMGSDGSIAYGGGIYVGSNSILNLTNTKITSCIAKATSSTGGDAYGGGLAINGGTVTMTGGSISGNSALISYSYFAGYGGGVLLNNGTFTMQEGAVVGKSDWYSGTATNSDYSNYATYGGGICVKQNGTVNIYNSSILYNYATGHGDTDAIYGGGGIIVHGDSNDSTVITIGENASDTSRVCGNGTAYNGGGINIKEGSLTMKGGTISANEADSDGGGISIQSGTANITAGSINNNTGVNGGGIYLVGGSLTLGELDADNGLCIVSENSARHGGGIYTTTAITMNSGKISSNTCSENTGSGGGIWGNNTTITLKGGLIKDNTVPSNSQDGGTGIYIKGTSNVEMSGNISIDSSNIVNLAGSSKITVTGALTGTTPAVVIKPASYNVAQQIITCSASDGTTLAKVVNAGYFGVSKNGTDLWAVAENGYLVTQYSTYFNQGVSYEASPADDKICGVVLLVKTDADNTYGTGGTVVYKNMSEDNDYGIEVGYEDNHPLPASWISGDQSDSPSESTDYSGWRPIKALLNSDANYTSCEGYYLKYYIKDLSGSYAPCFASEDDGADVWASSDGAQWDRMLDIYSENGYKCATCKLSEGLMHVIAVRDFGK